MKVKVLDIEITALAPKRRSDRLSIVGEDPTALSADTTRCSSMIAQAS
jgi:hypothetical protein